MTSFGQLISYSIFDAAHLNQLAGLKAKCEPTENHLSHIPWRPL